MCEDYLRSLGDVARWEPWARAALAESNLPAPRTFHVGDVGTFPVLLADNGLVVKFFGELFDGVEQHRAEVAAYRVLQDSGLPTPRLVATGTVDGRPYLVITEVPGVPYSKIRHGLSAGHRAEVARQLGGIVRRLHALPTPESNSTRFQTMLAGRRRLAAEDLRRWGRLSDRLCDQVDEFLSRELVAAQGVPAFIHADLHEDHVFVDEADHGVVGLIDFADSFTADPHYELVALHLGTFFGDKSLLREFLASYGWPATDSGWPRRMLAWTLAHEWDVLEQIQLDTASFTAFDELANLLWDLSRSATP